MKKNSIAVSLLALSMISMASCNTGGNGEKKEDTIPDPVTLTVDHDVTVTWWNNYQVPDDGDTEANRKNNTYREYFYAKDLIAAFEADNPHITVKTQYIGSYAKIKSKVDAGLGTGDLPSIASCYADSAYTWKDEAAINMHKYLGNLKADTDYNQTYLDAERGMYDSGELFTLPYSKSAETLVCNMSVFDQDGAGDSGVTNKTYTAPVAAASKTKYTVPTNWDEMIAVARKMKTDYPEVFANQKDAKGFFTSIPFCWDSAENMFISLMENANVPYTAQGKSITDRVLFNNDDAKAIVKKLKEWNNEGLICTQDQLPYTDESKGYHDYSSNMFSAGKIFMCVSSTAGSRYFRNDGFYASMNHQMAWGNGDVKNAKVVSQGPSLAFFHNQDEQVEDASFMFYQYLTSTENSAKLAVNTSYFPLRTSSYNTTEVKALTEAKAVTQTSTYDEKGNYYSGSVLNLNKTYTNEGAYFLSPVTSESATCRTAVGDLLEYVFNNKAETADEINTLVNTAFKTAYENCTK